MYSQEFSQEFGHILSSQGIVPKCIIESAHPPNYSTQLSQPDTSQAESLNQIRPKPRSSRSLRCFESTNQSSEIASRDCKSDPQQAEIIRQILAEIESAKFNLAKFLPDVSSNNMSIHSK